MKSVGSHDSLSMLFMMKKVMVWHFVRNSWKVMTELIKVCVKAVGSGDFSAISWIRGWSLLFGGFVHHSVRGTNNSLGCFHFVVLITISTKGNIPASFVWRINGFWDFPRIVYYLSSMGQGVVHLLKIISNTETNLTNTMGWWCAISFDD